MARGYRLDPDFVISRRLDTADGKRGAIIDGADSQSRAMALLSTSDISSQYPAALRYLERYVDRSCGGDEAVLRELAGALGLGGDR